MRQAWKISEAVQRSTLIHQKTMFQNPRTLKLLVSPISRNSSSVIRFIIFSGFSTAQHSSSHSSWPSTLNCLTSLFDKCRAFDPNSRKELFQKVSGLKDELVKCNGNLEGIHRVLDEKGRPIFMSNLDGSALVLLLEELHAFLELAVEVFNWRRKHVSLNFRITSEEYSKAIAVAGRAKNISLAVELFAEARNNRALTSSTYNALMGAYMSNCMPDKCQSLFLDFKREEICSPTTATYNILISVFGGMMLIDNMEATFQHINDSNISPNVNTFNGLIAGYITSWMWDRMESTYNMMKERSVEPNTKTHLLMLRGYALAGKLQKMEETYELVKQEVDKEHTSLIRCMICAYVKNPCISRINRVEELVALIPVEEYSSWLNVILIRFYAQQLLLEKMEMFINVAFEHKTTVVSSSVIRSIVTAYYKFNVTEKLAAFGKRAEGVGWRLCRSLYHCKMVMYGSQNRMEEMESVLAEMKKLKIHPTKKTFLILYKAYSSSGPRYKVEQIVGLMCKHGHGILLDLSSS